MRSLPAFLSRIFIISLIMPLQGLQAEQKGTPVFGRNDPSRYGETKNCHGGTGSLHSMTLLGSQVNPHLFETNLYFFARGQLPPKSGIGEHIHRDCEEMFFILNAPAEFTINGRTALLPAGSCVACPMGTSHGVYNNSDITLEWLDIAVTKEKGKFDSIDYGDDLTNHNIESPAPFKWAQFDRSLLQPVTGAHGGKGTLFFRRLWSGESFKSNWEWIDHVVLPPKTSIGYHQHNAIEEVYYIMSGKGRMTVNDHTWDVTPGDAIPCTLHDSHGIYNNTGEDLEIFVLGVSMEKGVTNVKNWGDDLSDRK